MAAQTFTEFLGEVPKFDDPIDEEKFVYFMEKKYERKFKLSFRDMLRLLKCYLFEPKLKKLPVPKYRRLSRQQQLEHDRAWIVLQFGIYQRQLEMRHVKGKIFDFGCGKGGASILMHLQEGHVTANDKLENKIMMLINTGLFPVENVTCGNGLDYMLIKPASQYDLVTAFFIGENDCNREFLEHFHIASTKAVKPGGRIVVTSDYLTMDKVREIFGVPQSKYEPGTMIYLPQKPSGHQ